MLQVPLLHFLLLLYTLFLINTGTRSGKQQRTTFSLEASKNITLICQRHRNKDLIQSLQHLKQTLASGFKRVMSSCICASASADRPWLCLGTVGTFTAHAQTTGDQQLPKAALATQKAGALRSGIVLPAHARYRKVSHRVSHYTWVQGLKFWQLFLMSTPFSSHKDKVASCYCESCCNYLLTST